MLDRDVLIGCAALAFHTGDSVLACQLLAAVGPRRRSPVTMVLYDHYRNLVHPNVGDDKRQAISEVARRLDPRDVLGQALERLRGATARTYAGT